jgi:hypothetical protein
MSTYTPIASQTLASAASSVTFTGVPQNFTDLVVVASVGAVSGTASYLDMQFNSDSATNYSAITIYGTGSATGSANLTARTAVPCGITDVTNAASTYNTFLLNVENYSNTTTYKTTLCRSEQTANSLVGASVSMWRNTSAINTVTLLFGSGSFRTGSTFNLYGIVSGTPKASGGTITTDGTYFYHTFNSSGVFAPLTNLTADYLVVAGGGGGGRDIGGGGGAGGLRSTVTATGGGGSLESALPLIAQNYIVTVGAGGNGAITQVGTSGSNSVFSTITSIGGGGGGGNNITANGATGGSGGGAGTYYTGSAWTSNTAGSGTANQGYAGGAGANGVAAAGGGGAGGVGGNASSVTGGNGGAGVAVSISGSSVSYAGGGGGAGNTTGGTATAGGGAGSSGDPGTGTAGTANRGGGGGGSRGGIGGTTNNGGSGIVIIRYAV